MSRQNEIPSKPGAPSPTLALIPLWDFCNHSSGHISTYFNVESSTCDCYAQRDFKANEEFRIFYGPRSNCELLLQQGFVYPENEFDSYQVKLGITFASKHTPGGCLDVLLTFHCIPCFIAGELESKIIGHILSSNYFL